MTQNNNQIKPDAQSLQMAVMPRFCDNCSFLNITEEEQNKQKNKDRHICNRYKKVLLHNGYHPQLPVLNECDYNEA